MRDRAGCAASGAECCDFTFRTCDYDDDSDAGDFPSPEDCRPEEYRKRPFLRCLRARMDREPPLRPVPAACEECGCPAEAHEAIEVSVAEASVLAVARRIFLPFDLSVCIRQSVQDTSNLGFWRDNFTYGEVNLLSFLRLLDRVQSYRDSAAGTAGDAVASGGTFFDLGCGAGKCVLLAAFHPFGFVRSVGVELLPGLHGIAAAAQRRLEADEATPSAEVVFLEADLFDVPLADAGFVLVNAGSWREPNLSRLRQHLVEALPDGCILATIRQDLCQAECAELVPLEELQLPMSWGLAPVFLSRRRRRAPAEAPRLEKLHTDLPLLVAFDLNAMD